MITTPCHDTDCFKIYIVTGATLAGGTILGLVTICVLLCVIGFIKTHRRYNINHAVQLTYQMNNIMTEPVYDNIDPLYGISESMVYCVPADKTAVSTEMTDNEAYQILNKEV